MNLYNNIKFLYLKIRCFSYGYCPYDFDGDGFYGKIINTISLTEFVDYICSLFIVIGIPLSFLSIILSFIFENIYIFFSTLIILICLFIFILFIIGLITVILELFLGSILKLIEGYNKYFGKDK